MDALGRTIVCVVAKNYSATDVSRERTLMLLINQLDSVANKVRPVLAWRGSLHARACLPARLGTYCRHRVRRAMIQDYIVV